MEKKNGRASPCARTVLALDPGTITGWAILLLTGAILSGTWDFRPRRGDGAGVRFLRLRAKLDEIHRLYALGHVVYELPAGHYKSGAADDVIKGLVAHIQSWCEAACVPYEGFAPSEVKKHATGKGNAPKDAVVAAARARWGNEAIRDSNEGDARWILDLATQSEA